MPSLRTLALSKFKNTFFPAPILFNGRGFLFGKKIFYSNAEIWRDDSVNKPEWYTQLDDAALTLLENIIKFEGDREAKILDVCCNVGRHLNYLSSKGYINLHGFDVMAPAIDKSVEIFPGLVKNNLQCGNIVDVIPRYANKEFDWAYTHSATIELIHPSFKIHHEMKRIVKKGCIFLLNEDGHSYPRHYRYIFERAGFITLKEEKVRSKKDYYFTLFVWVTPEYFMHGDLNSHHLAV